MINLENLTIQRGSRTIFSDFNSVIETGLVTIIKGENGSGKSTLLRALAGFTPLENGKIKLAAGWLIEQAGWKGKTIGNYGVHKNQALVLVNYGGSSGSDIYNLSEEIIHSIKETSGVNLEREVNIL